MINKLVANIKKTGAPIVVGLDPMLSYVPEQVQKKAFAEYRRDFGRSSRSYLAVQQRDRG